MRSLKTGLLTIAITGFFGMAAIVGCSADGSSDLIEDPGSATEPDDTAGSTLPPSNPGTGGSTSKDAGATKKDAGKKDAAPKDAGPPPPQPGDACTKIDEIFKKSCGKCGSQEAVCLASADGGATGSVSAYGPCLGETGQCIPGEVEDVECGNCGTAKKTCNNYCAWSTSACTGQPANSCKPGTIEYTAAGCSPSTYRKRDCQTSCTWTNYSTTCAQPVNEIVLSVAGGAGSVSSKPFTLSTAKMHNRLASYGTCPLTSNFSTGDYPYQYVEVKNTLAQSATLTIYATQPGATTVIDTIMAGYSTPIMPMDDAARKSCAFGPNDQSSASDPTGNTDLSILKNVTIGAGSSILVYVSTFYDYDVQTPAETTGTLTLNARIESLQ